MVHFSPNFSLGKHVSKFQISGIMTPYDRIQIPGHADLALYKNNLLWKI